MSAPHEVPGPPDQPEPVPCSQALHAVQTDQAQPGGVACYQFGNEAGAMLQHSALIAGEQLSQAEESQRRRNGRSSRRCMNAKGQHITGSGQLPVLDTYLSELSDAREPSAVTQSLAEGLYKHHEPPQLPHRIQSFYLGPEARQPDLYSSTGFLRRPASAGSSSSTLPHLHTAPSPYAHVKPRIWSSRAGGGSPQQLRHSQLLYGSPSPSKYSFWSPYSSHSSTDPDSSTAEPSLCTSAPQLTQASPPQHQQRRSSPPRSSLPRPPRLGDPLSKSIAAELQQQDGVLLRTTPQAAQLTHAHFRQQQQPPGPQVADSQVSLKSSSPPPTDKVAHAILYGPPLTSHPSLEPLKTGTSRDSKAAPFITTSPTTAGGVSAGIQPMPASASHQATQHKVQRFVADVGRVMGRLQHAATRSNSGGLEEGWGPEGKGPGVDAKTEGLARVMQWQKAAVAARQRQQRSLFVPLYTRVQLPPSLQGVTSASGKSGGAKLLRNLYEREGHTKSTIRKMLDQLPQLNRLESPLLQALSDKFVPYSYPPNSLMVAQGTACEEVFVLLSGQVLILPRAQGTKAGGAAVPKSPIGHQPQPVCVQPGAVLGVDHMLQRLQAPNDVRSDPHFECHVATLKWEDYERELCNWAASKVLQHLPGLQFSVESQLRTAILQHSMHMHQDAGTAVCTEGSEADAAVLLVQGQILLTKQLQQDAILTEGQLMQHLRMTLGPSQDIVTLSAHSPSKGASRGTKRKSTGRSKAFKAALLRRQAMQVPVEELANQQARQEGFGTVFEEGEEGEVSRSPSPKVGGNHEELEGEKSSDAGGSQSTQVPEGGAGPAEDIRESTSVRAPNSGGGFGHAVRAGGGAEDGAHADGEVPHASEHHSVHEQGVRVEAQEQAHGQEQGGQRNEQQQQQQQQQQGPPHVPEQEAEETQGHQGKHNKPFGHLKPPLHPHSVSRDPPAPQTLPSLRSKLSGTRTPSYNSSHQSTPTGAGGGSQRSSSQNDASSNSGSSRLASREAQNSRSGTPQRPYLLSGSGSGGRGAARPSQPVALVGAGLTAGKEIGKLHGHRRSSTHDGRVLPADGPGDGAHPAIHSSSSAADLGAAVRASATAPATPQHSGKVHEQDARSSGQAGELQSGEKGTLQSGGKITLHSAGKSTGAPEAQALKRQGTSGVSERHGGANREEQRSSAAGEHAGPSALQQQQQGSGGRGPVGDAEYPPTVASGTGDDESSESGAAVPEGLRGIPLLNALATMMKNHHQQVEAVFSQPVFMGTEALRASQDAPVHNSTMLCLQSTECILIPWAALAAVLPKASLALLSKRMQSQARTIATTAGPSQGAKIERWPECADILREFLQTKPGARPVWQAENLADGFSSVRALAQLPWQARLRLFQGLKFLVVEQADPALSLAIPTIQETAKPIAGINLNVPQLQGTAGSTGNDTDQAIQEGQEQGPGATPAEGEASAPAQREASTADIVQDTQKEDTKAEVEDGLVEEEQDTAGERKLRTTVTGALRGITASTAEADAAIARFQQQILQGNQFGNQDEQDKSPGAPTETTGEADGALHVSYAKEGEAPQTSDRTSGGSLHASSNPERAADTANANGSLQVCVPGGAQQSSDGTSRGKSVAGHISGKQGEAGPEQQQQAAHSVDAEEAEEGMPLYRSKSVLKAQLPPDDTRQLRSPESALSRLQAAAEAAELARLESEEATEIAHLDAVDAMGGGLGRGDQTVGYADSHAGGHANGQAGSFASFGGRSSEGVAPSVQQQQQQQQQQQEPRSVNWEEHKAQGNAKRSNASVSSLTASQRAKNVPETPDTDKFGSLKSWDGTASPDSHLLSPGPCTPPTQRPQGTSDPFPAAYHPYDMDAKVADRKPSADQPGKPPLPKAKSNRVEGQSLPSAGKPGPSLTEKPRIAPAALVDGPASETPPPFGTPHPPPPPPQNHTAALPPGEEASSAAIAPHNTLGQQGGADSSAPVLYVRRKVLVLDPNPEQKDDRHYIILSGSVELQAQPLSQEEMQAAIPPPAHQTALEQLAHRRRSAVRKQGLPPLVLATLGMGDAFNAKTAVELLRERMTAAYAPTAAAAEEGMEEGAGSGGAGAAASAGGSATSHGPHGPKQRQQQQQQQQQNAALPLPSGPCRIVAIVMSPRVELLAMNAVLFGLVVGGAGRPMAKLEVQDVLKQAQSSWLGELWEDPYSSSLASSPRTLRAAGDPADASPGGNLGLGSDRRRDTGLSLGEVAKELADGCRIEDYKQGLELLRRGEASACVYVIVSGCCVLRSSYMGLSPDATANGVISMDLLKAKAGETVGELSLIASRPLWYSLVVASPSARVAAIDLQALRDFTTQHMPPRVLDKMLHRVAEKDLRLYATAIHTQALLIQQGKIMLDMFTPTMKTLLKQVLMLGPIGARGVQGSALEAMEAIAKGNQAATKQLGKHTSSSSPGQQIKGPKKEGGQEGVEEDDQLVAAAKEVGPVVVEHANEANEIVEHLSRPSAITAQANEKMSVAQWERAQKERNQYLSNITSGSHVLQHSSFQLSTLLHAAQNPFGSHDVLGELAQGARFEGWSVQKPDHAQRGPKSVVHVCMPTASAPGEDPYMMLPSNQPRPAHRTEHKTGPRATTGAEVERQWDVPDGQAPSSVLSADEVMSLIRARVHLKRTNLARTLAQAHTNTPEDTSTQAEPGDEQEGSDVPVVGRVWGEGDAGFWDDSRYVREAPERSVIATEGVGSLSLGMRQQRQLSEVLASERLGALGAGRQSMGGKRASVSIARQTVLGDEEHAAEPHIAAPSRSRRSSAPGSRGSRQLSIADPSTEVKGSAADWSSKSHRSSATGGRARRLSIADQSTEMKGSASDWSSKRRARARQQSKVMAARSRGRVLQRRLTEWAWDDSANALQELTARHEDGSPESGASSSPSTDADPDLEAQRVEDARLLQFQFSALGQGKRDASRTRPSRSEAKSDARLESSFGVRLKPAASGALDDVSEGSEAEEREEEAKMAGDERSQQQQQQQQQQDNADSNQAGWSRQQQQPPRQDLSSAASSMRASMRGRPSSVQWSMDSRGGPDASVPQQAGLHPDVPPSLHPHLEGAEDVQRAWGGDIGHPELQGVPYAILEALASEPPERERPSIVHTFSMGMGMSARQTGEESLHSLGSRPGEQQGDVASASSSISRPPGSLASNPIWAGAEGHDVAESFKSASISSSMGAGGAEQPGSGASKPGLGASAKAAAGVNQGMGKDDTNDVDLRERNFWVRDCLHDPSGITNPSMSLLMGEALAGALAKSPTSSEVAAPMASPSPPLASEASYGGSIAAPSDISHHSTVHSPGTQGGMRAAGATDWRVRVQMPPPRGSLPPPKMHGLPGEDDEDGLRQGSHHNPDKELLQQLWQEHHKALADAREAERKRAIESRFEIAGPRSRSKGAPAAATGAAAEEQDSWEKQLGKVQTPGARQAVLRTLLKNNNHPMNQPSMPVKKSKPLSPAPPHTQNPSNGGTRPSLTNEPPKLPPASPAPAPLKDTKSATDVSKAQALWRRAALQQPLGKGGDREVQQQQQQQQQQRRGQGGGGQQLTSEKASGLKPTHPHQQQATASQAQHAALPSFSAKLMSKAHGRQRAAAFPHGVHGRPATAVGHEDTGASSLHSHQQQLRQQQQQLRHEAQGWWDPSFHDDTNDTAHGAVVAGVDGATYGSAGGEMAAAGAGGPDDAEGQHSYTSRQHTLPGSAEGAVQGAGAKRLEVDANVLTEEDLAYVTVQVPPRVRITPEVDLSSHKPQQHAQQAQPAKYRRMEPHVHMRAMMDKVSGPMPSASGANTKGEDSRKPAYVPTFLRSKRTSLAPEMARAQMDQEPWVVPQFSSTGGFEYGLYDVNNGITYFD